MYHFFYQIIVKLAIAILRIASLFRPKLKRFLDLRKVHESPEAYPRKFCLHCASLGEFEMARPMLEHLVKLHGREAVLISFFSPSGLEYVNRLDEFKGMCVYLPLDKPSLIREFLKKYKPEKIILVRYELWYNLLKVGLDLGCEFYLMNARFRKGHFMFSLLGKPYLKLLKSFKWIFSSDLKTQDLLVKRGIANASYCGDTRFDRVLEIAQSAEGIQEIEEFIGDQKAIVLGSSWWAEEEMMNDVYHELEGVKLIIAPHEIKEDHLIQIETLFAAYNPKRFSEHSLSPFDQVLIIDNIGMLSSLYRYADVAFIGGGFKGALHNIIEPAVWGSVILFGPDTEKFPEAEQFISSGFAFKVGKSEKLESLLKGFFNNQATLAEVKEKAVQFVELQAGASQKILDQLAE
ncbi:MAG: hypothetical protein JXR19_06335 [Bacteroidia bacterium]